MDLEKLGLSAALLKALSDLQAKHEHIDDLKEKDVPISDPTNPAFRLLFGLNPLTNLAQKLPIENINYVQPVYEHRDQIAGALPYIKDASEFVADKISSLDPSSHELKRLMKVDPPITDPTEPVSNFINDLLPISSIGSAAGRVYQNPEDVDNWSGLGRTLLASGNGPGRVMNAVSNAIVRNLPDKTDAIDYAKPVADLYNSLLGR